MIVRQCRFTWWSYVRNERVRCEHGPYHNEEHRNGPAFVKVGHEQYADSPMWVADEIVFSS